MKAMYNAKCTIHSEKIEYSRFATPAVYETYRIEQLVVRICNLARLNSLTGSLLIAKTCWLSDYRESMDCSYQSLWQEQFKRCF